MWTQKPTEDRYMGFSFALTNFHSHVPLCCYHDSFNVWQPFKFNDIKRCKDSQYRKIRLSMGERPFTRPRFTIYKHQQHLLSINCMTLTILIIEIEPCNSNFHQFQFSCDRLQCYVKEYTATR